MIAITHRHTLVLVRHGKSDWSTGHPDGLRPLTKRGERQAAEAGRWLAEELAGIDEALVSPATRAHATWDRISRELPWPVAVRVEDEAYTFSGHELAAAISTASEDCATLAVVGHNPAMETLAHRLTGAEVPMKTAAIAVVGLSVPWADLAGAEGTLLAAGRPPARTGDHR